MQKTILLYVDALDCASCISTVNETLKSIDIIDFSVSLVDKEIEIIFDDEKTTGKEIQKTLKKVGYKGSVVDEY